ncbi:alpha/beta hydrolase [Pantoea sp. 18069]|uniref:RBBP9/YdeN family alpha/beta hydrolase n=1 Tax=Pantoea sp. 18069 TaxID=2681415 RepID=UPI00135B3D37|nr:alpha/beta hydrolase [Pantoea sp. 18069]
MSHAPTFLIVPGLRDHVATHWQTLLAAELPKASIVAPLERDKLSCAARVDAITQALAGIEGPVVMVAHSAGCMMVAHWAQQAASQRAPQPAAPQPAAPDDLRRVQAALLVAPADLETPMPEGYPTVDLLERHGWLPVPRAPLPFTSLVAASSNDPLARLARTRGFASDWGSRVVELGPVGHVNPASGHGHWPQAQALLQQLLAMTPNPA